MQRNLYKIELFTWFSDNPDGDGTPDSDDYKLVVACSATEALAAAMESVVGESWNWTDDDGTERTTTVVRADLMSCNIVAKDIDIVVPEPVSA